MPLQNRVSRHRLVGLEHWRVGLEADHDVLVAVPLARLCNPSPDTMEKIDENEPSPLA